MNSAFRVFIGLSFAAALANGSTILFDSTGGTVNGSSGSQLPTYGSFSTGAATGALTGLEMEMLSSTPSDGLSLAVGLYADNSTSPGTLITSLGTIADSSLSTSPTLVNVALTANPALSASTRYWIGLSVITINPIETAWSFESPDSGTGVAGEYYDTTGLLANSAFNTALMMQVTEGSLTATPEPSSMALFAGALSVLALAQRRRN
jgi:hypothetical protein